MTQFQHFMLEYLGGRCRRIGSIWIWPQDVRRDPRIAERTYWMVAR